MPNAIHLVLLSLLATALITPAAYSAPASATAPTPPAAPVRSADAADCVCLERLSPRVVLAYWLGVDRRCNLTALATARGLVLIDSEMSPRVMAPIKLRLEQHFGRDDWSYVINTHAHDNHAGGNALFPNATIVGHANLPADMQWLTRRQSEPACQRELDAMALTIRNGRTLLARTNRRTDRRRLHGEIRFWELHSQDLREGYPIIPPALTFADRHTLDLGDLTLELIFFGRGHSNSDIMVYIPQERLLVSGAVFYQRNHLPEIAETTDRQDLDRFLANLDYLLAPELKIDRVIPSHSPPLRKSDLKPVQAYYRTMLAEVEKARRDHLTLDQTIQRLTVRAKFPHLMDPPPGHWAHGMQARNVRNLWRILSEEAKPEASVDAVDAVD